jgi:broad specificity phosphatase PhoE
MTQAPRLVLLRHGQSEWNAAGVFTGWENASLTAAGEEEATRAGLLMAAHGLLPGPPVLAAQRAALRRAPGPPQGSGPAGVRRSPVHGVAAVL